MISSLLFDVDGTLIDSVDLHARAWQEALAAFGVEVPYERVRSQIGKGGDKLIPTLVPPEKCEEIHDDLDGYRSRLFKETYLSQVKGFPQVPELFRLLRAQGMQIALASSAKGDELTAYKRAAGIEKLVDEETTSDEVDESKPEPDIFEAARERLGNPPKSECVVVGDSPFDAIAARKAGLRCIGMLCGGFPPEDLIAAGCHLLVKDPAALLERIRDRGEDAFEADTADAHP